MIIPITISLSQNTLFTETSDEHLSLQQKALLDSTKNRKEVLWIKVVKINPVFSVTDNISLNLVKENTLYTITKTNLNVRTQQKYSWYGKIGNEGNAIFVVDGEDVTGTITIQQQIYSLVPLGNGAHVLFSVDQKKYPPEHPKKFNENNSQPFLMNETGERNSIADVNSATCNPVIRVLVFYTPSVRRQVSNIKSLVQLAVDEANQSYANSKINILMQLADVLPVQYDETNRTYENHVSYFTADGDGVMDSVHIVRNNYTADICVLLVDDRMYCGIAADIGVDENKGFCIVNWSCATGYYSFAHEVGHLQGARHNMQMDDALTPYAFAHGYWYQARATESRPATRWRTVMSYDSTYICLTPNGISNCGAGIPRIQYWSNPDVLYAGVPMGTPTLQNNARVLNITANKVASFRKENLTIRETSPVTIPVVYVAREDVQALSLNSQRGADITIISGMVIEFNPGVIFDVGSQLQAYINEDLFCTSLSSQPLSINFDNNILEVKEKKEEPKLPSTFVLLSAYPNPCNPTTTISYGVPEKSFVVVKIYNIIGQEIATLVNEEKNAGYHSIVWDANKFSSGIYLCRFIAGKNQFTKKIIVMK